MPQENFYNWSGTQVLAKNSQVRYPKTVNEVQELVRTSSKIRVIGAGLSFEKIASIEQGGILINVSELSGLVAVTSSTATFLAGTILDDAFEALVKIERMMACSPGVIGIQTIAGALSTATHGQGLYQSSFADIVTSMELILPSGRLVNVNDTHYDYGGFVSSLGCLGVIVSVTVTTEPLRVLSCLKHSISFSTFKETFVDINKRSTFCKAWWFPETQLVHIWEANDATANETQLYNKNLKQTTSSSPQDSSLNETIHKVEHKMSIDTKDAGKTGKHYETVKRFCNATAVIGNIYQIFCKGIPVPQINCEIAVPLTKFEDALTLLEIWLEEHGPVLHYPFIFRCTGPSKAWLSPAYGQEVCYIGFLVYLAQDGTTSAESFEIMASLQHELKKVGGIPHLGKHFDASIFNLKSIIPKWNDFMSLKLRLDPQQTFENAYLKILFK